MKLSSEILNEAKACKSKEEIIELAKDHGVELSDFEATEAYNHLHKSGELSEEELNNVTGGGFCKLDEDEIPEAKFKVGDRVKISFKSQCGVIKEANFLNDNWWCHRWYYIITLDDGSSITLGDADLEKC